MKIYVLGCGGSAGVPMIGGQGEQGEWGACDPREPKNRRMRSSIILEDDAKQRLLVDTGPDLRTQLINMNLARVDAILYTHAHADHIAGLDEVRGINRYIDHPLDIYAEKNVLEELAQRFSYAFRPWRPPGFYAPVVVPHSIELEQTIEIKNFSIQTFKQNHGRIHTLGFRCQNMAYSTDVVHLEEYALSVLQGVDTWLVDCFQRPEHTAHANLDKVLEWHKLIKPRQTILTHMGSDMDWQWMKDNLPPDIQPAYDGMIIEI